MAKKTKDPTFEEALSELESITRSLESGSLSLDDSIAAYERGMELRKIAQTMLEKAEKKLEYLEKKEDGSVAKKPVKDETLRETQNALFDDDNS